MPDPAAAVLLPLPRSGRTFTGTRVARFGDLSPGGRLRLDALARYCQDVSSDDTADAGLANDTAWVVRRTAVEFLRTPRFREPLELTTFCSGTGGRWAERRVSITGAHGAAVEVVSLWVHVDGDSGRPVTLPGDFHACYDEAAGGRTVSARLQHDPVVPDDATRQRWALRFTDFDLLGHVNNAATWSMVEEVLAGRGDQGPPWRAELEYRAAIERGTEVDLVSRDRDGTLELWITERPGPPGHVPLLLATARVWALSPG
ncbi:MAG TPA: acyl-ACP thioesterase domain-containing protein [Acidimicrobiales bacterium]